MRQPADLPIVNISGYKFIPLKADELQPLKDKLLPFAIECDLKGTILLSTEGINSFLAGTRDNLDRFVEYLRGFEQFSDIWYKESFSDHQPFTRMLVRLKKEIISMGHDDIKPSEKTAPHLPPEALKRWYDEGKDMFILDTRNDYEIQLGTFEAANDLDIKSFRDFPEALDKLPDDVKDKPVVTFCTGGIRCEKAAQLMLDKGFKEVYQLEGGIINYFEQCGGDHYDGECFVFDKRVALDPELNETNTVQCYECRSPLTVEVQKQCNGVCPHCGGTTFLKGEWLNGGEA